VRFINDDGKGSNYSGIKRNCGSIEYMRFKILELKINNLETLVNLKDTRIISNSGTGKWNNSSIVRKVVG